MTTLEIIKRAKKEAEQLLCDASLEEHCAQVGKTLAILEIAEEMAAADAEALKDAMTLADLAEMDHIEIRKDLTAEEKASLIAAIKTAPVKCCPT